MLSETIKSIVKQLGYEDNMANRIVDSHSFNLESMIQCNYAEKKAKIKEIPNKKGIKVHD